MISSPTSRVWKRLPTLIQGRSPSRASMRLSSLWNITISAKAVYGAIASSTVRSISRPVSTATT